MIGIGFAAGLGWDKDWTKVSERGRDINTDRDIIVKSPNLSIAAQTFSDRNDVPATGKFKMRMAMWKSCFCFNCEKS